LDVIDVGDVSIANTTTDSPQNQRLNPVHAQLAEANVPKTQTQTQTHEELELNEPTPSELFP